MLMKKIIACVALCLILQTFFYGEVHAEIVCSCSESTCRCFIQMGDEGPAVKGIIKELHDKGYLQKSRGSDFDRNVYEAVCSFQRSQGISESGVMDDETLTRLLFNRSVNEFDGEMSDEIWVPTDGGKKRHRNMRCSGMHDPRKMSVRNAERLGMEPCKRCKPL